MLHAGRVVTRAQISQLLWSRDDETSNTITVHIRRLRVRLGDDHNDPKIIVSVRGFNFLGRYGFSRADVAGGLRPFHDGAHESS
jgi:DNA-binding response OmpR family regulator